MCLVQFLIDVWTESLRFRRVVHVTGARQTGKTTLVESWVYHELSAIADAEGGYAISQYRDKNKREVDFIVENEAGNLLGVEVKAGANVGKEPNGDRPPLWAR